MSEQNRFSTFALLRVIFWPLSLSYATVAYIFNYLSGYRRRTIGSQGPRENLTAKEAASRFAADFDDTYGPVHPAFFQGSYMEALSAAKSGLKFLLVYLHSSEHDDTEAFCRDVLCSQALVSFINAKDVLVWGGDIRDAEAFKVGAVYEAPAYPFVALVVQKIRRGGTGGSSSAKMASVFTHDGPTPVDRLVEQLSQAIGRYEASLQVLRAERREREASRSILEQQDAAYQASLQADREKKRLKEEAAMRKAKEAEMEHVRSLYRRELLRKVPSEPVQGEENTVRLSFRAATGGRIIRRFRGYETMADVYAFIDTYGMEDEGGTSSSAATASSQEIPEGYVHEYEFALVSMMPRVVFPTDGERPLQEIRDLWPSANLIVEPIATEE